VQIAADATGKVYTISTITDNTNLALTGNYTGTTNSSTHLNQYVANAICPLDGWCHAGFQMVGTSFAIGYFMKTGNLGAMEYSTNGLTFTTMGTLTADSTWRSTPTITLGSDGTYNVWIRWNVGGFASDLCAYNGDQFLMVTSTGTPSIAAVASSANAPGGSGYASVIVPYSEVVEVEGYWGAKVWGATRSYFALLYNTDAKLRFKAQCSEIWLQAYGGGSGVRVLYSVDGVISGATGTLSSPTPWGMTTMRSEDRQWWYKVAGGLDSGNTHEYTIEFVAGQVTICSVAVNGTFHPVGTPARGVAWCFGDSILSAYASPPEGFGFYIGQKGYNVFNQGIYGATMQYQYHPSVPPIPLGFTAPSYQLASIYEPALILVQGGYNDAGKDPSVTGSPITDIGMSRSNFRTQLQAFLANLRTIAPSTKIVMLNIHPCGNTAPPLANYNTDIATVITNLADANTVLCDVSTISPFYYCTGLATATATVSGGAVTGFTGLSGGTGYPPNVVNLINVTISGGAPTVAATAHASTNGSGIVTSLTLDTGGSGYTGAVPQVVIGDALDGVHPNYNGYKKIWAVLTNSVPTYSAGGGMRAINLGGGFGG
jgi:hypothetical protein